MEVTPLPLNPLKGTLAAVQLEAHDEFGAFADGGFYGEGSLVLAHDLS